MALGLITLVSLGGKEIHRSLNTFEILVPAPDWLLLSLPLDKDTEIGSFCLFIEASEKALVWYGSQQVKASDNNSSL